MNKFGGCGYDDASKPNFILPTVSDCGVVYYNGVLSFSFPRVLKRLSLGKVLSLANIFFSSNKGDCCHFIVIFEI